MLQWSKPGYQIHHGKVLNFTGLFYLREFVLRTTVILTPGACGREVPSGSPWTGSRGSAGKSGSPDGFIFEHFICVFTVKTSRVTKRYNVVVDFFMTAPSKTHTFDTIFRQMPKP